MAMSGQMMKNEDETGMVGGMKNEEQPAPEEFSTLTLSTRDFPQLAQETEGATIRAETTFRVDKVEEDANGEKIFTVSVEKLDVISGKKPPLGSGQRFAALESELRARGAKSPGGLAAYIGRKKYGAGKMASMSAKGRHS